ncbi:MAG: hypothetical protein GKR95_11190 [Gammaproteobacteria bacterium]|nr:hypothetical protein [Gammaproteobacteria bacterium]
MNNIPLFCFGSLMDWDVINCVLGEKIEGLSMVDAEFPGYRVATLPHESYPVLVSDEKAMANGKLLSGLEQAHLDRIIFFEGEEYQIRPCTVRSPSGDVEARFFDEAIMPAPEMTDWCFTQWQQQHKSFLLRQSEVYMSYYGKMSAAEADYYWQTYSEVDFDQPLIAAANG